jgi:hypothetical protein
LSNCKVGYEVHKSEFKRPKLTLKMNATSLHLGVGGKAMLIAMLPKLQESLELFFGNHPQNSCASHPGPKYSTLHHYAPEGPEIPFHITLHSYLLYLPANYFSDHQTEFQMLREDIPDNIRKTASTGNLGY